MLELPAQERTAAIIRNFRLKTQQQMLVEICGEPG
jgi:hypothetical protein